MQVSAKKNVVVFILLMFVLFYSCSDYNKKPHKDISEASINAGELLAKKYCQSCHLLPAPSLLNTESWVKGVLPNMGPRLGIFNFKWESYPSLRYDKNVPRNFYPSQPLLTDNEWQDIINYYTASSPDTLPPQHRTMPIEIRKDLFAVSMPPFFKPAPNTCYIKVDTTTIPHTILQSDVFTKEIIRYDTGLKIIDSIKAASAMVDIDFKNKTMVTCNIGVLNPNNGSFGKLQYVIKDAAGKMHIDTTFHINNLQRPVQLIKTDLNKDGLDDYLVCEFGYVTGSLNWYENKGKNIFTKHVLRAVPGAIKAYVKDYNNDGLPDIFVLFAQGDEGIFLFTNKGNGQFDQKTLLRFPPSYGSSYFELDDFNKDGLPDILYTCGDNADFSPVFKPYHGVYIFMNDGKYNFTQIYFFPINGCYKAMAADFNNDGNLDIAAISFFADYTKQPEEGFVYLKNIGGLNFKPYSVPEAMNGHWLTMDVGDIYGNGKKSILLGNFSRAPSNLKRKVDWKDGPPFLILNKTSSLIK